MTLVRLITAALRKAAGCGKEDEQGVGLGMNVLPREMQ